MSTIKSSVTPDAFRPSRVFRAGRDMPEGSIGWHVDCSDNPLDVRPAVETILRAIDEKRRTIQAGEILVVPVGENHACPSDRALFTLLAKEMKERGDNFVVSIELPHDTWKYTAKVAGIPPEKLPNVPVHEIDPDGNMSLSTAIGYNEHLYAPVSRKNSLQFLFQENIRTIFSDASIKHGRFFHKLDLNDPLTTAEVEKYSSRFCFRRTALDVTIRNGIIKTLTLEYARKNGAEIALVNCGIAHIFGDASNSIPHKHSLDVLFGQEAAVLPVWVSNKFVNLGLNLLEESAYPSLRGSVVVDGTAENMFRHRRHDDGSYEYRSVLKGQTERDFINKIYQAADGALPVPNDFDGRRHLFKKFAFKTLKTRLEDYFEGENRPEPSL